MEDVFGCAFGGEREQQVSSTVKLGQGSGAGFVGVHADADGFGPIVFALIEFAATMVANAGDFRWACFDVEDGFAIGTGAASAEASNDLLDGKFVAQDAIELKALFA